MTTHRRAWRLRTGVVAALVAGTVLVLPSPAHAEDPSVQITNLSNSNLRAGESADLQFTVENANLQETSFSIRVEVFDGVTCQGDCNPVRAIGPAGGKATFNAKLVAGNIPVGANRSGRIRVIAKGNPPNDNDEDAAEVNLTVRGPDQAPSIKRISGTVRDQATNEPIDNADVSIRDSRGQSFETQTNNDGEWSFTSSQERPIAPGSIAITVRAEGYANVTKRQNVGPDKSLTGFRISLQSTTAP
ncbi:MAG TPA: carboxypeptidase-like regulatory domain-containing protein, partial [Micromonosporaceae bacterium]|nr:carboxypeptidase-like regulatory domain-containing protein [Micromonosporaceae bacterium]